MWLMLQQPALHDYIIATGEMHSVREFCQVAFARVCLDWERYVVVDPQFIRPAEVDVLCGDSSRARRELGWEPKVTFAGIVEMMVDADLERVRVEQA
jgi:GDPmannose 4,6-dehydratase